MEDLVESMLALKSRLPIFIAFWSMSMLWRVPGIDIAVDLIGTSPMVVSEARQRCFLACVAVALAAKIKLDVSATLNCNQRLLRYILQEVVWRGRKTFRNPRAELLSWTAIAS